MRWYHRLSLQFQHYRLHDTPQRRLWLPDRLCTMSRTTGRHIKRFGNWPRSPTDAKRKYNTTQRESIVVVWAKLQPRSCSKGTRSTIRTNQDSLEWILKLTNNTERSTSWRLQISKFDFSVVHRAGVKQQAGGAFFCLQADAPFQNDLPL